MIPVTTAMREAAIRGNVLTPEERLLLRASAPTSYPPGETLSDRDQRSLSWNATFRLALTNRVVSSVCELLETEPLSVPIEESVRARGRQLRRALALRNRAAALELRQISSLLYTAEVHALLYISGEAVNTDEVMAGLGISRGNASTALRDLVDWSVVSRVHVRGDRKEYFLAEQDVWKLFHTVMRERKKREQREEKERRRVERHAAKKAEPGGGDDITDRFEIDGVSREEPLADADADDNEQDSRS